MLKKPEIQKISDIPAPDPGAPEPHIISDEQTVKLYYYLQSPEIFQEEYDANQANIACCKFDSYKQYKFGSPSDETIHGHPLHQYGLEAYAFSRVVNSPWLDDLIRMNKVHPKHSDKLFSEYQHVIGFFHDSCFEIICNIYRVETFTESSIQEILK